MNPARFPDSANERTAVSGTMPPLAESDRPLHLLSLLVYERRILLVYPIVITVVVVLVSFLFPNQYKSTVVILPPESSFQDADFSTSELGILAGAGMVLPMMATPSDILEAVLMSRTVRDSLVSRLGLAARWNTKKAPSQLEDRSGATVHPSGIITVWTIDSDKHFSDTLVNELVNEADRLNREIVNTKARRSREFIERRLAETRIELANAAGDLERFQNEHRTIALDAQIEAMIRNAAELKAQITADEIELSVLESSLSSEHSSVRQLRARISETQRRLDRFQAAASDDTTMAVFEAGLEDLPRLVLELAEITRRLKIAESLFTLLTERYETARIQEHRDTPSFSVLDRASGGGAKVGPMRAVIGLATLVGSAGLALALILLRGYLDELPARDPARHQALQELRASFRRSARRNSRPGRES